MSEEVSCLHDRCLDLHSCPLLSILQALPRRFSWYVSILLQRPLVVLHCLLGNIQLGLPNIKGLLPDVTFASLSSSSPTTSPAISKDLSTLELSRLFRHYAFTLVVSSAWNIALSCIPKTALAWKCTQRFSTCIAHKCQGHLFYKLTSYNISVGTSVSVSDPAHHSPSRVGLERRVRLFLIVTVNPDCQFDWVKTCVGD